MIGNKQGKKGWYTIHQGKRPLILIFSLLKVRKLVLGDFLLLKFKINRMADKTVKNKKAKFTLPQGRFKFSDLEDQVTNYWKDNKIFEKSVETKPKDNAYVFYDGPPFVTGTPHYGHLLGSYAKDLIPRYWTMKGKRVERVWGWDCHGLPVEEKVERKLGTKNRRDIENKVGLEKFIGECYNYVQDTSAEWNWYIDKIARWVDMDNAYRTMDQDYMESVIWVFKQFYDKGLVYKGRKSLLYCPRCGTPVSKFEIAMDNSYKDLTDPTVTVKFKVKNFASKKYDLKGDNPVYILAWTTTPWTLPANLGLAVDEKADYVTVLDKSTNEYLVVAKDRFDEVFGSQCTGDCEGYQAERYELVNTYKGKELVGLSYEPLFDFYLDEVGDNDRNYKIYAADFVTMDEGTGIVHMAPGFGEEDFEFGKKVGLSLIDSVDDLGRVAAKVTPWAKVPIKEADPLITEALKKRNLLFAQDEITHSYPICYRCSTPLIYRTVLSWFIKVEDLKDSMLKTGENINWVPAHLKEKRFKNTMKTAPDWCVSRTRYWASPVPIWQCDTCQELQVVGSRQEIEELSGKKVDDLHRPEIDKHTWACQKKGCRGTMRRVSEVLDCWFESGSMPFAQNHYPFENKEHVEANFPCDFIAEYIAQVRAWFYYLHVVGNGIMGSHTFNNVICTGVIQGDDGRKMSKSFGNYPDPRMVLEKYGGDALRLYLMNSVLMKGDNVNVSEEEMENQVKLVLLPFFNIYKYFSIYAEKHNYKYDAKFKTQNRIIDDWVLDRVQQAVGLVIENLDKYLVPDAVRELQPLIEDISTWYIRSSRQRFVAGDKTALHTLFTVLLTLVKAFAPIAPFITEYIYLGLKNGVEGYNWLESVHLEDYPKVKKLTKEQDNLLEMMAEYRLAISMAHNLRIENNLPLKQALAEVQFNFSDKLEAFLEARPEIVDLIRQELNVQKLSLVKKLSSNSRYKTAEEKDGELGVALDVKLTQELKDLGLRRDFVRSLQMLRRELGLEMGDLVEATVYTDDVSLQRVLKEYQERVQTKAGLKNVRVEKTDKAPESAKLYKTASGVEFKAVLKKV